MKVLFAGPSLHGTEWISETEHRVEDVLCAPPAAQGDIARMVIRGASVIGLIDGRFEDTAAVWHKEILYALENGVQIFGAASMGALRAAECAVFGMIGVGIVYERYASGELADDAAVAQVHAPAELGSFPLTEALVNVEASLERFQKLKAITIEEAAALKAAARRMFFKERTWPNIIAEADLASGFRGKRLLELVARCKLDVKREDALTLARYLAYLEPTRLATAWPWRMQHTKTWDQALALLRSEARPH
jgi:hypothetical protein